MHSLALKEYMDYREALEYIHNTLKFGSKLGLHNIGMLMELMGNPQDRLKYVHVAGTNGKGSTAAFISSILMSAGYKVGTYTSPYIQRFTERIKINNAEIIPEELARAAELVKSRADTMVERGDNHPTEFEIVTAIAFQYFYEQKCDIVVLEVGLGGRFDSTNIIKTPCVSVITTISLDHTSILGNTLPQIAFEKAGIIKQNGEVVIYPQQEEAQKVFIDACRRQGAVMHSISPEGIRTVESDIKGQIFDYEEYKGLKITLMGDHQVNNAVMAVKCCELLRTKGFNITGHSIREGLLKTKWPGRLEVLQDRPAVLIDGAHNAEGASALYTAMEKYFHGRRKIFIMGVLKDKDYNTIVEAIAPIAHCFITVSPNSERSLPADELAVFIRSYCKNVIVGDTIKEAVRLALDMASEDDVVCAFGSLYYIGEVRGYFI